MKVSEKPNSKPIATPSLLFQNILFFYVYVFIFVLGLPYYTGFFSSSCGKWGLLFLVVCRLLIAMASPVVEHGLQGSVAATPGL